MSRQGDILIGQSQWDEWEHGEGSYRDMYEEENDDD